MQDQSRNKEHINHHILESTNEEQSLHYDKRSKEILKKITSTKIVIQSDTRSPICDKFQPDQSDESNIQKITIQKFWDKFTSTGHD